MKISVLYFASLREAVGTSKEVLSLHSSVVTVSDLIAHIAARGEHWRIALDEKKGLRCALNQDVVQPSAVLQEGAEIAFFPPVTGG
jgi:sulfur-carrier protein